MRGAAGGSALLPTWVGDHSADRPGETPLASTVGPHLSPHHARRGCSHPDDIVRTDAHHLRCVAGDSTPDRCGRWRSARTASASVDGTVRLWAANRNVLMPVATDRLRSRRYRRVGPAWQRVLTLTVDVP